MISVLPQHTSFSLLPLVLVLTLPAACSGPANTTLSATNTDPEPIPEPVVEADFDVNRYQETPPPARATITHDAPDDLLRGRAGERLGVYASGFRIQVLATRSKEEADLMSGQVIQWWIDERAEDNLAALPPGPDGAPPVYQDFREPFWRVRIGNFSERPDAVTLVEELKRKFDSAFVVPAQIRVQ